MPKQRPKVFGREPRLIAHHDQDGVRRGFLAGDTFHSGSQRRTHPFLPGGVENGFNQQSASLGRHLLRFKSDDNINRRTSGFHRKAGGAVEKRFTINPDKLLGSTQPRRGPGGEDDRSAAKLRHAREVTLSAASDRRVRQKPPAALRRWKGRSRRENGRRDRARPACAAAPCTRRG